MKKLFIFLIPLFILDSCEQKGEQVDALFKEVMEIHDEVMPEMSSLRKMAKALEYQVDSLSLDSLSVEKPSIVEMKLAADELREANKKMMDWMYDFKQIEPGMPDQEAIDYLKEQKILVNEVKTAMLDAKKNGETLLK